MLYFLRESYFSFDFFCFNCISEKGQIETIGLGGNPMSSSPVEGELLLFLQNVNSLKNLHLNYTNLRPSFGMYKY